MKTALVIGATGLVGRSLTSQLLDSDSYQEVITFTRRPLDFKHPKFLNHVIDFDHLDAVAPLIQGDELFSCLGTTVKQAGSFKEQFKVDFHYQYEFAMLANQNKVEHYLLVSSAGASSTAFYSPYLKMKARLESAVTKLSIPKISFIRPSVLVGERENERFLDGLSSHILETFKGLPLVKKYRPISGETVAKALINAAKLNGGIYELEDLFELAESSNRFEAN